MTILPNLVSVWVTLTLLIVYWALVSDRLFLSLTTDSDLLTVGAFIGCIRATYLILWAILMLLVLSLTIIILSIYYLVVLLRTISFIVNRTLAPLVILLILNIS